MNDLSDTPRPTGDERQSAMLCHLLGFAHLIFPLAGILAPFLLWNSKKDDSDFIDRHGKEAVNFQITFGLIILLFVVLMFGSIAQFFTSTGTSPASIESSFGGIFLVGLCGALVGLAEVILMVLAAVAASSGREFSYPIRIRFLK